MGRGNRGGKGKLVLDGTTPGQRDTLVSKKISYVLRHGAQKERLKMDEKGFVNCADLVSMAVFPLNIDYWHLCTCHTQRFELLSKPG